MINGAEKLSRLDIAKELRDLADKIAPGEVPPVAPGPDPVPVPDKQAAVIDDYFASMHVPWDNVVARAVRSREKRMHRHAALADAVRHGELPRAVAVAAVVGYKPLAASAIIPASMQASLPLAKLCAVLEQESAARSIFHADWGQIGADRVPFAWLPVTRPRVNALKTHINAGGVSNGVGTMAVTFGPFVIDADKLPDGGLVNPYNQTLYGARILKDYMNDPGLTDFQAYAAYNAGPDNLAAGAAYAREVQAKESKWKARLAHTTDPVEPDKPGATLAHGVKDGTNFSVGYKHLLPLIGSMPYEIWVSGNVPDGPMAWAANRPLPPLRDMTGKTSACMMVGNIIRRGAGKIVPTRGNLNFDGGVAAYFYSPASFPGVGVLGPGFFSDVDVPFDLQTAKRWAKETQTGVLIGRNYVGNALSGQGHIAVLLPDGIVLQSTLDHGLNVARTIEESHAGFYYTVMVHPKDWIEHDLNKF